MTTLRPSNAVLATTVAVGGDAPGGVGGVVGGVVGATTVQFTPDWLVFPAVSDTATVNVCAQSASPVTTYGLEHGAGAEASSVQVNAASSSELNPNVAVVLVVDEAGA